jgi:hypothetical protein
MDDNGPDVYAGAAWAASQTSKALWGTSAEIYFRADKLLQQLANPNLYDIPTNLPFRVEMWGRNDQHVSSVAVGHAALDAAIANYPHQRFTLRNGILVIRQHPRT